VRLLQYVRNVTCVGLFKSLILMQSVITEFVITVP
jgi:hypothetical protein